MYNTNIKNTSSSSSKKTLTPKAITSKIGALFANPVSIDRIKSSSSFSNLDSKTKMASRPLSTKSTHPDKKFFTSKPQSTRKRSVNSQSPHPLRESQKSLSYINSRNSNYNTPTSHTSKSIKRKSYSPSRMNEEVIRQQIYLPTPKQYNIKPRQIRHSINSRPHIQPKVSIQLPKYQPARFSDKAHGTIRCYSACTNQGVVRDYNEDRVAIVLKKIAYFGVFDGHGGDGCSNYLRDKLVSFVLEDKNLLSNLSQAINQGFHRCEYSFLEMCKVSPYLDRSGSCAIAVFIHGQMCYVSNVGDSRAIMSSCGGQRISQLSVDHKPTDPYEQKRIIQNGGKIYQTKLINANPGAPLYYEGEDVPFVMGPHRVLPGRLSVTRTFGDIQGKLPEYGGNIKAIIATPQIRSFRLTKDNDFIIIASRQGCYLGDGIYDKLSNDQIIEVVWQSAKDRQKYKNIHEFCGLAAENIIKYSIFKKTQDNVTVVMIGFQNLQRLLFPENFSKAEFTKQIKKPTSTSRSNSRTSKLFGSKEKNYPKTSLKSSRTITDPKKLSGQKPTTPKGRPLNGSNRTYGLI